MLSRHLSLCCLLVLAVSAAADASGIPAGPSGSSGAQGALEGLEGDWGRLRARLSEGPPLSPELAPALAGALRRLEPALDSGELSPHRVGAGLAAVITNAARRAGAGPVALSELEAALREVLPPLLERPAATAPLSSSANLGAGRDVPATLLDSYCALEPEACQAAAERGQGVAWSRLLRSVRGEGLPESIALALHAELAPSIETPR